MKRLPQNMFESQVKIYYHNVQDRVPMTQKWHGQRDYVYVDDNKVLNDVRYKKAVRENTRLFQKILEQIQKDDEDQIKY